LNYELTQHWCHDTSAGDVFTIFILITLVGLLLFYLSPQFIYIFFYFGYETMGQSSFATLVIAENINVYAASCTSTVPMTNLYHTTVTIKTKVYFALYCTKHYCVKTHTYFWLIINDEVPAEFATAHGHKSLM